MVVFRPSISTGEGGVVRSPQDPTQQVNLSLGSIWLRILAWLAIIVTACGLKNYLAVVLSGTALCPYLCPSVFPTQPFFPFSWLESFIELMRRVYEGVQGLADSLFLDPWNLTTNLVFAPVFEELVFRGPMFLTRGRIHDALWWSIGIALTVLFLLSHGRHGLALLPLFVLGIGSLYLIATTHRFWPTIALHFLNNFFFWSTVVYQSAYFGD